MGLLDDFDRVMDRVAEHGTDLVEQETYQRNCLPVLTLQSCITWAKKMRERFPQSMAFLISIQDNPTPRNENDNLILTLAMLDGQNKPVIFEGTKGVSTQIHGKTIDQGLMNMLNGQNSMICKF